MNTSTSPATLRIGLATMPNLPDRDERLATVVQFLERAATEAVAITCFPETYLPGLRGMDFEVPAHDQSWQEHALETVRAASARTEVAAIVGMEWATPHGLVNTAFVTSRTGEVLGHQTKNQIPLEEANHYVPGATRQLFEVDGVPFGITICHEGWRYPEATRWAARRGAKIVFHPHLAGSDKSGPTLTRWCDPDAPYYEKAMLMRSIENTIYFASVGTAFRFQEAATSLIDPEGALVAHAPYGQPHLLVEEIDLRRATGLIANRFAPERYPDLELPVAQE